MASKTSMKIRPRQKLWSTKYALTRGVQQVTVVSCGGDGDYVYTNRSWGGQHKVGRDIFLTEREALSRAVDIVNAKAESIRRQLERLEKDREKLFTRISALASGGE